VIEKIDDEQTTPFASARFAGYVSRGGQVSKRATRVSRQRVGKEVPIDDDDVKK
jgi:hypothetical protein